MIETRKDSPSTKVLIQSFKSWHEFVDVAEHGKVLWKDLPKRTSRQETSNWDDLSLGNWQEVLELAKKGWVDKTVETKQYRTMIVDRLAKQVKKLQWVQDVTGTDFDIGRLLNGSPDAWISPDYKIQKGPSKRLLKITVNICVHAAVDSKLVIERGLIIMALCQLLEYSGRRVELIIQSASKRGGKYKVVFSILAKKFQAMLDVPRCLFALAHPGALRRIEFAVSECLPSMFARGLGVGRSYGSPDQIPLNMRGDIHFDTGFFSQSKFDPFEWLLQEMKAQGVEFTN